MPGAVRTLPRPLAERLAAFVERTLGLFYPEERWVDLERGVGLAAEELGYRDATACAEHLLAAPPAHAVVETLTAHLTVGETFFFRGMETFQALEHEILPAVLDLPHHRGDPALRVWSAACSTGEEPYTLAMILRSAAHDLPVVPAHAILATDLNPRSLVAARTRTFRTWSMRETPEWMRRRYFTEVGPGEWRLDDAVTCFAGPGGSSRPAGTSGASNPC